MKLINEKGIDRIQFNINKKDQQNEPNKPINNPSNDLERKLSGALLVAPGGNIVKVGHSLSRTGTDRSIKNTFNFYTFKASTYSIITFIVISPNYI